jgi:hypothetical protein
VGLEAAVVLQPYWAFVAYLASERLLDERTLEVLSTTD